MGLHQGSRKRDPLYGEARRMARFDKIVTVCVSIMVLCALVAAYMAHY